MIVPGYAQFGGAHSDCAALQHVLAYRGAVAPHTGQPPTEALLLGISGGVSVLYFVFEYAGHDPHFYLGTRFLEDPLGATCARLGLPARVQETTSAQKAAASLTAALAGGQPAIVWADRSSLPYNGLKPSTEGAAMLPLVVYGYDADADQVLLADRAGVSLTITLAELAAARALQASTKHRMVTLSAPAALDNLAAAVTEGIRACVAVYTEAPKKGFKNNFGLAALLKWAEGVADPKDRKGWPHLFPPGPLLYDALVAVFRYIELFETSGSASRPLYADFLDEAAGILNQPALGAGAALFREAGRRWSALAAAVLPDTVDPLAETRALLVQRNRLFRERGQDAQPEMQAATERLAAIRAEMGAAFPLDPGAVTALLGELRAHILGIHAVEAAAVAALRALVPAA